MQTVRDVIRKGLEKIAQKQGLSALQVEAFVEKGDDIFREIPEYHRVKRLKTNRSTNSEKVLKTLIVRNATTLNTAVFTELELSIVSKAATIFGITLDELISRSRQRDPVDCRNQVNAILVLYLRMTTKRCGFLFNKDHSTILNSLKRHSDLIDTDRVYLSRFIKLLTQLKAAHPETFEDLDPSEGVKKYATQEFITKKMISFANVNLRKGQPKKESKLELVKIVQ